MNRLEIFVCNGVIALCRIRFSVLKKKKIITTAIIFMIIVKQYTFNAIVHEEKCPTRYSTPPC